MADAVSLGEFLVVVEVHGGLIADVVSNLHLLHTVVFLIATVKLGHLDGWHSMVNAAVFAGVALHFEREVNGLTHLALLEQGSVTST